MSARDKSPSLLRDAGVVLLICALAALSGLVWRQNVALAEISDKLEAVAAGAAQPKRAAATEPPLLLPKQPIPVTGAVLKGKTTASAAMVIYTDFLGPYCQMFATDTLKVLESRYVATGQLLVALKQNPLRCLHPAAPSLARAALCTDGLGQFWRVHDRIFENPKAATPESVRNWIVDWGQDRATFDACVSGTAVDARLAADEAEADQLEIQSTPHFILGQFDGASVRALRRLNGARPLPEFVEAIDAVIQFTKRAQ